MDFTCLLRLLAATLLAMVRECEPAVVLATGPAWIPSVDPITGSIWARMVVLGPARAIGSCDGCKGGACNRLAAGN